MPARDIFFDDLGIGLFQLMDFGEKSLGSVFGRNCAAGLVYGLAMVVLAVHDVYRDAGLFLPCGDYGPVDVVSVHALASV